MAHSNTRTSSACDLITLRGPLEPYFDRTRKLADITAS